MTDFGTLEPEVAKAIATADEPRVVGRAIYLELINETNQYITQVLITPAGIDSKGNKVNSAVIYRSVSEYSPRSQWRTHFGRQDEKKSQAERTADIITNSESQINRLFSYGYTKLRNNTPIVLEITNLDLDEVREWKAPASAIRRLTKARASVGFPAVLWEKTKK